MLLKIENHSKFVDAIYNYIIDTYEILPREFEINSTYDECTTAVQYENNGLVPYNCERFKKIVHTHETPLIYCTVPEIVAATYIHRSVFGPHKIRLLETLAIWLPNVTIDSVYVQFTTSHITSNLFPNYAIPFCMNNNNHLFNHLVYTYIPFNVDASKLDCISLDCDSITTPSYIVNENHRTIMVRARSPSPTKRGRRNRSKSPSGTKRKSGTKVRRSSRSPSPTKGPGTRSKSPIASNRKRSRSRSPNKRTTAGVRRRSKSR